MCDKALGIGKCYKSNLVYIRFHSFRMRSYPFQVLKKNFTWKKSTIHPKLEISVLGKRGPKTWEDPSDTARLPTKSHVLTSSSLRVHPSTTGWWALGKTCPPKRLRLFHQSSGLQTKRKVVFSWVSMSAWNSDMRLICLKGSLVLGGQWGKEEKNEINSSSVRGICICFSKHPNASKPYTAWR